MNVYESADVEPPKGKWVPVFMPRCGHCANPTGVYNPECPGRSDGRHWRLVWRSA